MAFRIADVTVVGTEPWAGHLLIDGDRIVNARSLTRSTKTLEAPSMFVVPGLIDMHVHLTDLEPDGKPDQRASMDAEFAVGAHNLKRTLAAGTTTVRDLACGSGATFRLKRAWTAGQLDGARPLVAGPMLTAASGHGTSQGIAQVVTSVSHMRETVRALVSEGADVIKMAASAASSPGRLPADWLKAGVEAAHAAGVPVAIHANFLPEAINDAVMAGCDTLEHGCVLSRLPQSVTDLMADRRSALCPTLSVLDAIKRDAHVYREQGANALVDAVEQSWDSAKESVIRAKRSGVPIIAGTDAGCSLGVDHGSLVRELELLVAIGGLSHSEAFAAATSTAASALRSPRLGDLRHGAMADFLVVREDPRDNVSTLWNPLAVFQSGTLQHLDEQSSLDWGHFPKGETGVPTRNRESGLR